MQINYSDLLFSRIFNGTTVLNRQLTYFKIQDNIIGNSESFITLTGLPKAGKSTFLSAIISSAIINKPIFTFELKLFPEIKKTKIGYFDTEQSAFDFSKTINRIKDFTGIGDRVFDYLDCFLTNSDSVKDILGMIHEYLLTQPRCGILVIDGLLDLIENLNDEGSSKLLIRQLKKWAKEYNLLIISVLHLGKKDLTSIGHLGSNADRYAQSVLLVEKSKNNTLICSGKYLRSAPGFTQVELMYNINSNSYIQIF